MSEEETPEESPDEWAMREAAGDAEYLEQNRQALELYAEAGYTTRLKREDYEAQRGARQYVNFDFTTGEYIMGPELPLGELEARLRALVEEEQELVSLYGQTLLMMAWDCMLNAVKSYCVNGSLSHRRGKPSDVTDPDQVPPGVVDKLRFTFAPIDADPQRREMPKPPDGVVYADGSSYSSVYPVPRNFKQEEEEWIAVLVYIPASEIPWLPATDVRGGMNKTGYPSNNLNMLTNDNAPSTQQSYSLKSFTKDAFPDGQGKIPNNQVVFAGLTAIWKGGPDARKKQGGWYDNEVGRPVHTHHPTSGGRINTYPKDVGSSSTPLATVESLWRLVESLSPYTGDVALAVLAHLCEASTGDRPKYPLLEPVKITADDILGYKGIQRWGKEHRLAQKDIYEEMERLRTFHFDIERITEYDPDSGKWTKKGVSWEGDHLFDIVKTECTQLQLDGGEEVIETAWLVRAGQWAYWWLNPERRVLVGRMARILLSLDHQGRAIEKKVRQRLAFLAGSIKPGQSITMFISTLLEDIGELPIEEEMNLKQNWAGRTRKVLEDTFEAIETSGTYAVRYPNGYPTSYTKGWKTPWLKTLVQFTPVESVPDAPETLPVPTVRRRGRPKKLPEEQAIDGAAIRRKRTDMHLDQEPLAKYLGISRPYLSEIENGKRPPSKALARRIRTWMEEPSDPPS